MTESPTTHIHSVQHEAWLARAVNKNDFYSLTHDEQNQLARDLGQTIQSNLNDIGRMEWALGIERRLINGWAMPGLAHEIGMANGICMS
jgi:hypothetical protein